MRAFCVHGWRDHAACKLAHGEVCAGYRRELAGELAACLVKMQAASDGFYAAAVRTGNHAFIEWAGLINEHIKLCREAAERGEDFRQFSVHTGARHQLADFHRSYILEKLDCIYGTDVLRRT